MLLSMHDDSSVCFLQEKKSTFPAKGDGKGSWLPFGYLEAMSNLGVLTADLTLTEECNLHLKQK